MNGIGIATKLSLTSRPNPVTPNAPVVFTATVVPAYWEGQSEPTGHVGFNIDDGPNTIEVPVSLIAGYMTAIYSTTFPTVGDHGCGAQYRGDTTYAASNSQGCKQIVAATVPEVAAPTPTSLTSEIVAAVNVFRGGFGLPALIETPAITADSLAWSQRMANGLGLTHGGVIGFRVRMKTDGLGSVPDGECIAAGQPTPAAVVRVWENDAAHRHVMLGRQFTRAGASMVLAANGTPYWDLLCAGG